MEWTENVQSGWDLRIAADRDALRSELADLGTAIADRKARLKTRTPALRTVREYEKLIAEDEAKRVNVAEVLAATEAELKAVQQVLEDPAAAKDEGKVGSRRGPVGAGRGSVSCGAGAVAGLVRLARGRPGDRGGDQLRRGPPRIDP